MKRELARKWCDALRSGKYIKRVGEIGMAHSAMGVLSDLIAEIKEVKATGIEWDGSRWNGKDTPFGDEEIPFDVLWAIEMDDDDQKDFLHMDHYDRKTYSEIAEEVERKYLSPARNREVP